MIKFLVPLLISFSAIAAPSTLEVWIVSNSKVTAVNEFLNRPRFVFRPLTAELQCQEMGDYCFDPQVGLYKPGEVDGDGEPVKLKQENSPTVKSEGTLDRNLIDCDKNNYFDVFCGKARPEAKVTKTKLDLWIDTSSSMKEFDFADKEGGCYRKSLVSRLDKTCSFNQEVNVMMFDTSIKQAGTMDSLCNNQGLNDYKRLIDWMERSDAKHLVVITDVYELHKDFADYVASKNGVIRGDKDPLTAEGLLNLVDDLAKTCR